MSVPRRAIVSRILGNKIVNGLFWEYDQMNRALEMAVRAIWVFRSWVLGTLGAVSIWCRPVSTYFMA